MRDEPNRLGDILTFAVLVGLLVLVYLLPPDTAMQEIEDAGILRVCIPPDYPPLVTGDSERPGYEIELLEAVAEKLDLRLITNVNSAIGSDFNPRNWRVTRAQCNIIAGGVVATDLTRSFLDTTPPHLETGWVLIGAEPDLPLADRSVGFFAGLSGRDRLALSRFLRGEGADIRIVQNREEFVSGLQAGTFEVGVTDALIGRQIAGANDWNVVWVSGEEDRDPVAFGLWKGDLTLKRALVGALNELRSEGLQDALLERYEIAPIEGTYEVPNPD